MLNNENKKELRDYFSIKNISSAREKEGFYDVNMYYDVLLARRDKMEQDKKNEIEQQEKDNKKKLKNKLKKLRKRINRKVKQFSDSSNDETDDEVEQVKPYIFFTPSLQSRFDETLYLIGLLNQYYEINEAYRNFLLENGYDKLKITRLLHRGFTDDNHFNGYFYSGDDVEVSGCIHFYVENDVIKKLSKIVEIF